MAVHKWRKRPTKHFGDVWVPFAQIELTSPANKSQTFAVQIDSGAVVSLLRKSVADLLDIELESGKKIDVSSVGGAKTIAYIHELQTRFDDNIMYPVPYAIADTENVPNLLGRLEIFDRLQINFDGTMHETTISSPWLDESEKQLWKYLLETEQYILKKYLESDLPDTVKSTAKRFIDRACELLVCIVGLKQLHRTYATPVLIRSMFELALQFEYLMKNPVRRSQQYLDFTHITKHKHTSAITENPTGPVSKWLASSPNRDEGEKRNKENYDRVRDKFISKGKLAINWYKMSIRSLAKKLDREGEYKVVYALCSSWAHGDPFSTQPVVSNWITKPQNVFLVSTGYYARMLLNFADAGKIILSAEQDDFLKQLSAGFS